MEKLTYRKELSVSNYPANIFKSELHSKSIHWSLISLEPCTSALMSQCCRIKLFSAVKKLKGRWTPSLVCTAGNVLEGIGTVLEAVPALQEALFIASAGTTIKPS